MSIEMLNLFYVVTSSSTDEVKWVSSCFKLSSVKDLVAAKTRRVTYRRAYVQACNSIFASNNGSAISLANLDMTWRTASGLTMSSIGMGY